MRVLSLIHQDDAPTGTFADSARARGDELTEWNIARGAPPEDPRAYDAVFIFGGAMHVDQETQHPWLVDEDVMIKGLLAEEVPLFGVCLGAQLIAKAAGAGVGPASREEIGWHEVELTDEGARDPLFDALPRRFEALQWHSYAFELPPGAVALATSPVCLQGYRMGERAWGVQFHPEVDALIVERWLQDPGARGRRFDLAPMERWNGIGRALAARFLESAAPRPRRLRRGAIPAS
jgi:GMP synthase-like glutamine amidotransferase